MPTYLKIQLGHIQDRICSEGLSPEELRGLSHQGAVYRRLFEWAMKEPEKEQ